MLEGGYQLCKTCMVLYQITEVVYHTVLSALTTLALAFA